MNVLCFCSFDLNLENLVIRFLCISVQIPESIIPTRPDNQRSTVTQIIFTFSIAKVNENAAGGQMPQLSKELKSVYELFLSA